MVYSGNRKNMPFAEVKNRRVVRCETSAPVCTHGCSVLGGHILLTAKRCINAYKPGPTPHAAQLVYRRW